MFAKRTLSALLAVVLCVVCFAGCKKSDNINYEYNGNAKIKTLESCVIAENDNLRLSWNNDKKGIALLVKSTGKVWKNYRDSDDIKPSDTVGDDAVQAPIETVENTQTDAPSDAQDTAVTQETNDTVEEPKEDNNSEYVSTLDIYYQSQNTFLWDLASSGSEKMRNKRISAERVKNGIKLTYYFDKVKISVPVTYVLRKDSMEMSIDSSQIGEEGKDNRLISVSPSRYLMTVDMKEKDAYIFVSDGIGALVDTQLHESGVKKDFGVGSANSASLSTTSDADPYDNAGMRAYGIKIKDDALFCIAEQNPASLTMHVNAGDISSDSSKIYGDLCVADSDYTMGKATNAGEVRILSDRMQSVISVGFYPLTGEDANYVGMAKCYQKYLRSKGYISDQKRDFSSPYAVTALGGVMVTESVLGVPKNNLKVATTFDEAKDLFASFSKDIGINPVTRIKGFGETGLNTGKIGGAFKFASSFGSSDSFEKLQKLCKNSGKTLYTDFDLIKYSKSGNGFSYENDSAKTATLHSAEFNTVNVPLRDFNKSNTFKLLSRTKLDDAVEKLISFVDKKNISGVSLTTLGSMIYSDYTDIKYAVGGKIDTDTKSLVQKIKKSGVKISGSSPAFFAAGLMDTIFEAPLEKSGKYQFMVEIPFYQMVYSGLVPMYSAALNTASNPSERLMLAASSGTGIGVSVIKNFETSYMQDNVEKLYSCNYEYASDLLKTSLSSYGDIYEKTAGKQITGYEFLNSAKTLTVTEFENGVKVYANHSSVATDSPVGKLEGYGFKMESGD